MRKGFTLLELVVVIVVIGILAAIAIPTFAGVISRAHVASARTTAQAIVTSAKASYSFDHAGVQGVDNATMVAAGTEAGQTLTGGASPWTATIDGRTVTFTAAGTGATVSVA